jgi:hypothetical protein
VIASLMALCAAPAHAQNTAGVPFPIVEATIDDIHTALRSGRLTARQLVQGCLDRINEMLAVRGRASFVLCLVLIYFEAGISAVTQPGRLPKKAMAVRAIFRR